ncbi:MAG TPA: MCP four helix bundle domain-containing protein, partial [Opitutales bacterium]|nr:MCP four helix bundle domain-containing protein [Opitutales bacterium]
MNNWTISKRITVGFAILSIITISVGIIGFVGLKLVSGEATELVRDDMPSALILGQVKDNLSRGYANIETSMRATNASKKDEALSIYNKLAATNTDLYAQFEQLISSPDERQQYDRLLDIRKGYAQILAKLFETDKTNDKATTYAYMDETFIPAYRVYRDQIDLLLKTARENSETAGKHIEANISVSVTIILLGIGFGLALAVTIAIIIIRGTNKVLEKAITAIDEGSAQVAAASSQVSAASNMLAEGASEQAASLEETSSSLEEMSSMTARNAASAQEAKALADDMHQAADSSSAQMAEMQKAMDAIKESSSGISQ